jgi:maleate cis-trans isomerase
MKGMSNPQKPLGWRKRIGVLSPTVIETAAYDFCRLAPEGVSMCAITANVEHWSKENFKRSVLDPLVTAAKYLASRNVDYIMHCGMPVVTTRGKGFEEEIVKIITDATGLPASTSIRSAIRALAHLRIQNVVVLTPYPQELHQSALTFLSASGFHVIAEHTEDVVFKRLQDVSSAHIVAAASCLFAAAPAADGIYIPCNQWAAADAAPLIEDKLGIPVVTGAHADHWEAFRTLGIHDRIDGQGRLMLSLSNGAENLENVHHPSRPAVAARRL